MIQIQPKAKPVSYIETTLSSRRLQLQVTKPCNSRVTCLSTLFNTLYPFELICEAPGESLRSKSFAALRLWDEDELVCEILKVPVSSDLAGRLYPIPKFGPPKMRMLQKFFKKSIFKQTLQNWLGYWVNNWLCSFLTEKSTHFMKLSVPSGSLVNNKFRVFKEKHY